MSVVDAVDIPFLNLSDPNFSIRSAEVREARERSWYARTPYGLAVLRHDEMGRLLTHPSLRQGSHNWPALSGVPSSLFGKWWTNTILVTEGEDHARLRRAAMPAFSGSTIKRLRARVQGAGRQARRRLHRRWKLRVHARLRQSLCGRRADLAVGPPSQRCAPAAPHHIRHCARVGCHLQTGD